MSFSKMKNLNPQSLQSCLNRRSLRTRFAIRFLESLRKLSARKCIRRRSQMIKLTADASMASVVGPQRAWSRATLLQIRWRTRRTRTRSLLGRRKKNYSGGHRTQEEKLRELVPGGKAMDASILLEETAHYIKCLTHQVFVMRSIVDYCSI